MVAVSVWQDICPGCQIFSFVNCQLSNNFPSIKILNPSGLNTLFGSMNNLIYTLENRTIVLSGSSFNDHTIIKLYQSLL